MLNAKHSTPILTAVLIDFVRLEKQKAKAKGGKVSEKLVRSFIEQKILGKSGLGFEGELQGGKVKDEEVEKVWEVVKEEILSLDTEESDKLLFSASQYLRQMHTTASHHEESHLLGPVPGVKLDGIRRVISDIAARRAEIGFSTSGHTGIDINVYAYGSGMHKLVGNQDNTNIGSVIKDILELDLEAVTRDLNKKK